jgi:hypothetical protein
MMRQRDPHPLVSLARIASRRRTGHGDSPRITLVMMTVLRYLWLRNRWEVPVAPDTRPGPRVLWAMCDETNRLTRAARANRR